MPNFITQTVRPLNSDFNTGIDRNIVIVDENTGQTIYAGKYTELTSKNEVTKIKVKPLNNGARTLTKNDYEGWTGTITIAREDGSWDAFQAIQEAQYHAGQSQHYFSVYETTSNQNGTVDEFHYVHATLNLTEGGTWRKESDVPLRIEFDAEERIQLSQ